ncbi:MAG: DUF1320 domain-containing protein [bacterium]|jgi:phage gp36-like protein
MVFLIKDDFKTQVKETILNNIIEGAYQLLDAAEAQGIAQMTSYLAVRYDVPQIFNKQDTQRNPQVMMVLVDLCLYHLYSRIQPGQVPDLRQNRYDDAIKWLEGVAAGKFLPDLPLPTGTETGEKYDVQYGSRPARNPYY